MEVIILWISSSKTASTNFIQIASCLIVELIWINSLISKATIEVNLCNNHKSIVYFNRLLSKKHKTVYKKKIYIYIHIFK